MNEEYMDAWELMFYEDIDELYRLGAWAFKKPSHAQLKECLLRHTEYPEDQADEVVRDILDNMSMEVPSEYGYRYVQLDHFKIQIGEGS